MPQPTEGDIMAEEEQTVTDNQNRAAVTSPAAQAPVEQTVTQSPQQDNNEQQNNPAQDAGQ